MAQFLDCKSPCFCFVLFLFILNQYLHHKSWPLNLEYIVSFYLMLLPSLSLSISICLSAFPEGKVGQWAKCFFGTGMGSKGKRQRGRGTSIHSPIILYSWSTMCFYYLKHSPSKESLILSHCEAIICGAISTEAKNSPICELLII